MTKKQSSDNKKTAQVKSESTENISKKPVFTPNEFKAKYIDILKKVGLTGKEAVVYESLLKTGETGVRALTRSTPYRRGDIYNILYSLRDKGIVQQTIKGKKINFRPNDPVLIENYLQSEQDRLREAKQLIGSITPALEEMFKLTTERPIVRVYEGESGIKELYRDTLKETKTIHAFLNLSEADWGIYRWLREEYVKKRKSTGIRAKVVISAGEGDKKAREYIASDESELRETRVVSYDQFPAYLEIQVYGNKVSFANYKKGEALVGVVIDNQQIAKTMESLFFLAWNSAKK